MEVKLVWKGNWKPTQYAVQNAITKRNGISQLGHQKLYRIFLSLIYQQHYFRRKGSETLICEIRM